MKKLSERLEEMYARMGVSGRLAVADKVVIRSAIELARSFEAAPVAIMDRRDVLGICAPAEEDFPALYALQGKRVRIVPEREG